MSGASQHDEQQRFYYVFGADQRAFAEKRLIVGIEPQHHGQKRCHIAQHQQREHQHERALRIAFRAEQREDGMQDDQSAAAL